MTTTIEPKNEIATFSGGCFWCTESDFLDFPGVTEVVSGYTGGSVENPTYDDVCSGTTGHAEAIQITFDPEKTSYTELLEHFWKVIDPTDPNGQFGDRGTQYRTGIFYHSKKQKELAEQSKQDLENSGKFEKPIVTEITKFEKFYRAEEYHQNYCKIHPIQYKVYRMTSGRDAFIKKIWGNDKQ